MIFVTIIVKACRYDAQRSNMPFKIKQITEFKYYYCYIYEEKYNAYFYNLHSLTHLLNSQILTGSNERFFLVNYLLT